MAKLLIVDDDPGALAVLDRILSGERHELITARDGASALKALSELTIDLALIDIGLPDLSGLEVLEKATEMSPQTPVIVVTGNSSVDSAVGALRQGAVDYVSKPVERDYLLTTVRRILELSSLRAENRILRRRLHSLDSAGGLVANSPAMVEVMRLLEKISLFDTTVLLTGESGTGKSLIARLIHEGSLRSQSPFVKVNCGAIPENLLESELFGYKKGAFTGAHQDKNGLFQQAEGGTLLLDEIGELPLNLQVKLLHAVQERCITPVGSGLEVTVDVRLIAATNRNLAAEVSAGRFREDLYYRLNVFEINMPPLRHRLEDIAVLAQRFLDEAGGRIGKLLEGMDKSVVYALQTYEWPGNVRELENTIESSLVLTEGNRLKLADLPPKFRENLPKAKSARRILKKAVADFERDYIKRIIALHDGDKESATKELGVNLATLYRKLK